MIIQLILGSLFLSIYHFGLSQTQECYSSDDPHMKTFDGTYYEFQYEGSHFVMYTDFKDTKVTASYQECYPSSWARCNCAVYVKRSNAVAFIDFCNTNAYDRPFFRFHSFTKNPLSTVTSAIKQVNCKAILPIDEYNEAVWNTIIPFDQYFKCAQIGNGGFVTYLLRTYHPKASADSIKIRVEISYNSMPRLIITPSENSFQNTGGLCGLWDNDRNKDLYVFDPNGGQQFTDDSNELKEFWRLNSVVDTRFKRCPECFLEAERRLFCPCDTTAQAKKTSYCNVPMPNCIEKSLGLPLSPIIDNTHTSTRPTVATTVNPITKEAAEKICKDAIENHPGLKPLIKFNLYDPSEAIRNCIGDLVVTHEKEFVDLHLELSINQALLNILANETYYVGGIITDVGLNFLLGLCPSSCNGNGKCVINKECLNTNNKNSDHVFKCLSPVVCECNSNYGGPNCAVDLAYLPDFILSKKCCNIRDYNCEKLSGYGYPLPRGRSLKYKVAYTENDGFNSISYFFDGIANIISDNEFTFDLPFNLFWYQGSSYVNASVGVSFDGINYKYQDLYLYDPKCRECNEEGVLFKEIKPQSCLISNKCYEDGENQQENVNKICDSSVNQYGWTFKASDCNVTIAIPKGPIIVNENEDFVKIPINLLNSDKCKLTTPLWIDYHTEMYTATASDFGIIFDKISLSTGDETAEIKIRIINDNIVEPFEYFKIKIDKISIANYLIQNSELTVYINDDDYNKPNSITDSVFDLMNRSHAESFVNIGIFNQIVDDPYNMCPGYNGVTSEEDLMEIFFQFLDSEYDIYTIEVNNPNNCNLKHMTAVLGNDIYESIIIDNQLFIDVKSANQLSIADIQKVEILFLTFDETKDGKFPKGCELKIFGK